MKIEKKSFGQIRSGVPAILYSLTNSNGILIKITNYGGIITELHVPDKNGIMGDVVLGYDDVESYVKNNPYFGSLIGRCCNRISKGEFHLKGKKYNLEQNDPPNHLHGGSNGFHTAAWDIESIKNEKEIGLKLEYESVDGEGGYPGSLKTEVIYTLNDFNELRIDYKAVSDKPTICNLTNHSYFNLKDGGKSDILDHEIQIFADQFLPVDNTFIPLGEFRSVKDTPFDFRSPKKIHQDIYIKDEQLTNGLGYDHSYVLESENHEVKLAAVVTEETSGRKLEVFTNEPGMQFYSGNFLDGSITGKNNINYKYRHGFCLETQHYPDSPNHPEWPSVILNPGDVFKSTTIFKFSLI